MFSPFDKAMINMFRVSLMQLVLSAETKPLPVKPINSSRLSMALKLPTACALFPAIVTGASYGSDGLSKKV